MLGFCLGESQLQFDRNTSQSQSCPIALVVCINLATHLGKCTVSQEQRFSSKLGLVCQIGQRNRRITVRNTRPRSLSRVVHPEGLSNESLIMTNFSGSSCILRNREGCEVRMSFCFLHYTKNYILSSLKCSILHILFQCSSRD